jgi:hypothetical protein
MRSNAFYVLIPSLLPLANALQSQTRVDYAAHLGGAIGGVAVGLLMLAIWPRTEPNPRLKPVATLIALAGVVALAYPVMSVLQGYEALAFTAQLIPVDKYPKNAAEMRAHASQLIAQYPHDPRPRFTRAADLLDARDLAGASAKRAQRSPMKISGVRSCRRKSATDCGCSWRLPSAGIARQRRWRRPVRYVRRSWMDRCAGCWTTEIYAGCERRKLIHFCSPVMPGRCKASHGKTSDSRAE